MLEKTLKYMEYFNPGKGSRLLGIVHSGLSILLIILCIIGLIFWQVNTSYNSGENHGIVAPKDSAKETSPLNPANNK